MNTRGIVLCFACIAVAAALPPVPSVWPFSVLHLGEADTPGGASAMASTGIKIRYQYLTGDATDINQNWLSWQEAGPPYGLFVERYIEESQTNGILPVFTYYMIVPSSPNAYDESKNPTKLQNAATMNAYYTNLKAFFQAAVKYPSTKVVLHIEPDMWGSLQQNYGSDDSSTMPVSVASSGFADVAGYANTLRGYAQAIQHMRDLYASNVMLAFHISVWGTNTDITYQDSTFSECVSLGKRAGNFYNSLQVSYELAFAEFTDRDSGFYERTASDSTPCAPGKAGCPHWFTEDDWTREVLFFEQFVNVTNKRIVFWQIPYGNTIMRACNNVNYHYQDTRPQWLLDSPSNRTNINRFVNIGVMGFLFGKGNENGSCSCDDAGDGITNPAAINGNTQTSYSSDDDGGYFMNRANAYYTQGAITLPGGVAASASPSPASPSTSPSRTPSSSVSSSRTPSVSPSRTPSRSPASSPSSSPSSTPSRTASPSRTPSVSPSPSRTPSPISPSSSPSSGASASVTPSRTPSQTPSQSPASSQSSSPAPASASSSPQSNPPSPSRSPSSSPDSDNQAKKKDNTTSIMAGAIAGGGFLLVAGIIVAAVLVRNQRRKQSVPESNSVPLGGVSESKPSHASQFVVGSPVQALYSDGQWYAGVVKQVGSGQFLVSYSGYNEDAWLPAASVRRPN